MAGRKSRYTKEESPAHRLYTAALYIRLSREDGDREESDSVANQREILSRHAAQDESIASWEAYVDDGYSGTNFARPAFERMMEAVRAGRVNCVLVKDLSRFGRNYIEVGRFLEQVFPPMGVRFVSVNDYIDTYRMPAQASSIIVPFKNLINDEYSRDISQKIRSALDSRRRSGEFIGSFACYGYEKDPERRGKLCVDAGAAEVVRRIYRMAGEGTSKAGIVRALNADGIPNPSAYKALRAGRALPAGAAALWRFSTVSRILQNRMYAGDMVQGKNGNISYKLQKTQARPEDAWFVVENTHEAIIEKAEWERVQALLARDTREDTRSGELHVLSGFVRCADCGHALNRRRVRHAYGEYEYYYCPTYRASKEACTKHAVRVEQVEQALLSALRTEIERAVSFERLQEKLSAESVPDGRKKREAAIAAQTRALDGVMSLKRSAYEDWKAGDLSREEFMHFKAEYDAREDMLRRELEAMRRTADRADDPEPWLARLRALRAPKKLERALVCALVDMIYVHEGGRLVIDFKFSQALDAVASRLAPTGTGE